VAAMAGWVQRKRRKGAEERGGSYKETRREKWRLRWGTGEESDGCGAFYRAPARVPRGAVDPLSIREWGHAAHILRAVVRTPRCGDGIACGSGGVFWGRSGARLGLGGAALVAWACGGRRLGLRGPRTWACRGSVMGRCEMGQRGSGARWAGTRPLGREREEGTWAAGKREGSGLI
jgi:hypothetical protein